MRQLRFFSQRTYISCLRDLFGNACRMRDTLSAKVASKCNFKKRGSNENSTQGSFQFCSTYVKCDNSIEGDASRAKSTAVFAILLQSVLSLFEYTDRLQVTLEVDQKCANFHILGLHSILCQQKMRKIFFIPCQSEDIEKTQNVKKSDRINHQTTNIASSRYTRIIPVLPFFSLTQVVKMRQSGLFITIINKLSVKLFAHDQHILRIKKIVWK